MLEANKYGVMHQHCDGEYRYFETAAERDAQEAEWKKDGFKVRHGIWTINPGDTRWK